MSYAIQIIGYADNTECEVAGRYVQSFNFDGAAGRGIGRYCLNQNEAKRFDTKLDAIVFTRTQSRVKPLRDDGMPNRPMTGMHVAIVELLD